MVHASRRTFLAAVGGMLAVSGVGGRAGGSVVERRTDRVPLHWPSERRTRQNNPRAPPGHSFGERSAPDWSVSDLSGFGRAIAAGGFVYYVGGSTAGAYVEATGERVWEQSLQQAVTGSPALSDGMLVIPHSEAVTGLDPDSGTEQYHQSLPGQNFGSVGAADGRSYLGGDGSVVCIDSAYGSVVWEVSTDGPCYRSPAVVGGNVICPIDRQDVGDRIVAIDDGARQWGESLDNPLSAPPIGGAGTLYVTAGERVIAIDAGTGARAWEDPLASQATGLALAPDTLVVTTFTDELIALQPSNGDPLWDAEPGGLSDVGPSVSDGLAYVVGEDDRVYAHDLADGTQQWDTQLFETPTGPPIIGAHLLLVVGSGYIATHRPRSSVDARIAIHRVLQARDQGGEIDQETAELVRRSQDRFIEGAFDQAEEQASTALQRIRQRADTQQQAEDAIADLASRIENTDLTVTAARADLQDARDAFDRGDYESALEAVDDGVDQLEATRNQATEAQATIGRLEDTIADAGSAVDTSAAEAKLTSAETAYEQGEYEEATTLATEGLDVLASVVERAESVQSSIQELEQSIETTAGVRTEEADSLLQQARAAYEDGDYELAAERVRAGEQALQQTVEAEERASEAIENLRTDLSETDLQADEAAATLERAQAAYDAGDYDTALTRAEDGAAALSETREQAASARERIDTLSTSIEESSLPLSDIRSLLQRARQQYRDGQYGAAEQTADEGLAEVERTETAAQEARTAIRNAADAGRHVGVDTMADVVGYDEALAAARRAYENEDYVTAKQQAQAAQDRYFTASVVVDGGTGATILGGAALYRYGSDLPAEVQERWIELRRGIGGEGGGVDDEK